MRILINFGNTVMPTAGSPTERFYQPDLEAIQNRGAVAFATVTLVYLGNSVYGVIGVDARGNFMNDPLDQPQHWLARPCPPECEKLEQIDDRNWLSFEQAQGLFQN